MSNAQLSDPQDHSKINTVASDEEPGQLIKLDPNMIMDIHPEQPTPGSSSTKNDEDVLKNQLNSISHMRTST